MPDAKYEIKFGENGNFKSIDVQSKTQAKRIYAKVCRYIENKRLSWTVQILYEGKPIRTTKYETTTKIK